MERSAALRRWPESIAFDRDGEVFELSPAREVAVTAVAAKLVKNGGVALFVDYGHARSGKGDTLHENWVGGDFYDAFRPRRAGWSSSATSRGAAPRRPR